MLVSLLYKATPDDLRLILVDPKMLELSVYDGIPHLLTPVITDMKDAANGLRWCVAEMERRYKLMSLLGVRNLAGYNRKVKDAEKAGTPIEDPLWIPDPVLELTGEEQSAPALTTLPSIVVVIDEFADMMMIVGKKVEELIARIAKRRGQQAFTWCSRRSGHRSMSLRALLKRISPQGWPFRFLENRLSHHP